MSTQMTRDAFAAMVEEDIAWLDKQPCCLERIHIEAILKASINCMYPAPETSNEKEPAVPIDNAP